MPEFKGFAGSPKIAQAPVEQTDCFLCGIAGLSSGNLEEAYRCFSQLPHCPAALFNLAVCFQTAKMYEKALECLECAENQISAQVSPLPQSGVIPAELLQHDAQGEGYRMPMSWQTPTLFPAQAKLRILRLKADLYDALGYKEELLKMMPLFSGKNYKNIEMLKAKLKM